MYRSPYDLDSSLKSAGDTASANYFKTQNPIDMSRARNYYGSAIKILQKSNSDYYNIVNKYNAVDYSSSFDSVTSNDGFKVRVMDSEDLIKIRDYLSSGNYVSGIDYSGKDSFGKPVNSGIYIYRLQSSNFSVIKRMTLIR